MIQRSAEEILELHEQITNFLAVKNAPAVFVLFLGVVNHWVALVLHRPDFEKLTDDQKSKIMKGQKYDTYCYLMDSSNIVHLD